MTQIDGLYLVGQQIEPRHDNARPQDLIESAPSEGNDSPFDLFAEAERNEQLAEAVRKLSEREQLILSLYYREELTMKEIAQVVGIAVSRVSQIHAAVMGKLRNSLVHMRENRPVARPDSARQGSLTRENRSAAYPDPAHQASQPLRKGRIVESVA
jgi:RNA polymerase sigma factor for flagellar operon FliA